MNAVTHETAMSDMWGSIFWAGGAGGGDEGKEGEAWWMWSAREGGSEVSVGQLLAILGEGGGGGDGGVLSGWRPAGVCCGGGLRGRAAREVKFDQCSNLNSG